MNYDQQVQLPVFHFRSHAKREYSNWRTALVREFVQNSVDAGATRINFTIKDEDNFTVITVVDNGKGMSLDDCQTKLLTMGGSDKGDESIGGYGVAKQILYFAWEKWVIKSRNYEVHGMGCRFGITESDAYVNGVTSTIYIDKSEDFNEYYIRDYLTACETVASITVNEKIIATYNSKGRMIRDLGWATLHQKKTENGYKLTSRYMSVRVRGVKMFQSYLEEEVTGRLTLELKGHARDILTSNRDNLKNEYDDQYRALCRDLVVNTKSALREKNTLSLKKFVGAGDTILTFGKIIDEEKFPDNSGELPEDSITNIQEIVQIARENLQPEQLKKVASIKDSVTKTPVNILMDELSNNMKRPDILVCFQGRDCPAKYNPNTWSAKIECMMALWHLIIMQILMDNNVACTFGIGITLEDEVEAEFIMHKEVPHFLLNPSTWFHKPSLKGFANRLLMIMELKQKAIHELGHFAGGTDHNEKFILTCHWLEANTWKHEHVYKLIAKLKHAKFGSEIQNNVRANERKQHVKDTCPDGVFWGKEGKPTTIAECERRLMSETSPRKIKAYENLLKTL